MTDRKVGVCKRRLRPLGQRGTATCEYHMASAIADDHNHLLHSAYRTVACLGIFFDLFHTRKHSQISSIAKRWFSSVVHMVRSTCDHIRKCSPQTVRTGAFSCEVHGHLGSTEEAFVHRPSHYVRFLVCSFRKSKVTPVEGSAQSLRFRPFWKSDGGTANIAHR